MRPCPGRHVSGSGLVRRLVCCAVLLACGILPAPAVAAVMGLEARDGPRHLAVETAQLVYPPVRPVLRPFAEVAATARGATLVPAQGQPPRARLGATLFPAPAAFAPGPELPVSAVPLGRQIAPASAAALPMLVMALVLLTRRERRMVSRHIRRMTRNLGTILRRERLVGTARFELATYGTQNRRATKLRYAPNGSVLTGPERFGKGDSRVAGRFPCPPEPACAGHAIRRARRRFPAGQTGGAAAIRRPARWRAPTRR